MLSWFVSLIVPAALRALFAEIGGVFTSWMETQNKVALGRATERAEINAERAQEYARQADRAREIGGIAAEHRDREYLGKWLRDQSNDNDSSTY